MKSKVKLGDLSNFVKTNLPADSVIERKQYGDAVLEIQEGEERTFVATISTQREDADGDILVTAGADFSEFVKNPLQCWNHSYSIPPVGRVLELAHNTDNIVAKVQMAETEFATELWSLVSGKFLRCCSIGFIPVKVFKKGTAGFKQAIKDFGLQVSDACQRIITEWLVLENSLCPLPANTDSLIYAYSTKSLKLGDKLAREMGLEVKAQEDKPAETPVDKPADKPEEVKVEDTKTEDTKVEDTKTEEAKTEEAAVIDKPVEDKPVVDKPVEDKPVEPEPVWTVIREGDYVATDEDKVLAKSLKSGKVV